jgi:hypothetical protein
MAYNVSANFNDRIGLDRATLTQRVEVECGAWSFDTTPILQPFLTVPSLIVDGAKREMLDVGALTEDERG